MIKYRVVYTFEGRPKQKTYLAPDKTHIYQAFLRNMKGYDAELKEIIPIGKVYYGIWNDVKKEFQFGIKSPTIAGAIAQLTRKIGYDAKKWRFEPRIIEEINFEEKGG